MNDSSRTTAEDSAYLTITHLEDIHVPRTITEEGDCPAADPSIATRSVLTSAQDLRLSAGCSQLGSGVFDGVSLVGSLSDRLDARDFRPSWPMIAALEQLSGWAMLSRRRGTLALIQQCMRKRAQENARADVIVRLRARTDALAHMPLKT